MPVGVLVNVLSVAVGGVLGTLLKNHMPKRLVTGITSVFGICGTGLGILSAIKLDNLSVVVLAVVIGSAVGLLLRLGDRINTAAGWIQGLASRITGSRTDAENREAANAAFITIIVIFCASGTGVYGALFSGMTGDHSILIAKSVLDLFTAAIFACSLGLGVSMVAVPQAAILLALYFGAGYILPLATPEMIADFQGCGGLIMIATGLRVAGVKDFPVADMIPGLVLVMPLSALWTAYLAPLLG